MQTPIIVSFVIILCVLCGLKFPNADSGFIENTLEKFENNIVSLTRLDSGFCSDEIMSYLANKSLKYIVAAKLYHPIQRQIAGTENWNVCFAGKDTKNDIYVTSENIYNWRLFSKN